MTGQVDGVHILRQGLFVTQRQPPVKRTSYRHGDLRRSLVAAGIDLAREGGPDSVILREATRRAGVAPNAAYRHFTNRADLLREVCEHAMASLADAMDAATLTAPDPLQAAGVAYLRFARDEPGLFLTAFASADSLAGADESDESDGAGENGLTPFGVLARTLDDRVTIGDLPADRRPGAEFAAWSAVHGLAMLLVKGPLRDLDQAAIENIQRHLLAVISRGL
jgi:AcrR family transcriptional regulator